MASNGLRSQSLIFTLYGDYIQHHGDRVRIGSLIKLLSILGASDQAVRTSVSRMARRGWLKLEREGKTSFYFFTPKTQQMIAEGAERILHTPPVAGRWNHCWHLVTYSIPEERRAARDQFRRDLAWLGYGMLTNTVWLSPRNQRALVEARAAALDLKSCVQMFSAELEGFFSCKELVARTWNLDDLNADYSAFIRKYAPPFEDYRRRGAALEESECFVQRFRLIHEYRRFPYRDPQLPAELLPADWHGTEAIRLFQEFHQMLAVPAIRYFKSVYQQ